MPFFSRPARACLDCRRITTNGSRCVDCAKRHQARVDQNRGTRTERGLGNDWQAIVKRKLRETPYCVDCGTTQDLTGDHVVPRSQGGENTLDNCVIRCRYHNSSRGAGTPRAWAGNRPGTLRETTMRAPGGELRR